MDAYELDEFKKNIDFMDIMLRMSCASARLAFGAGLERLPLDYSGEKIDSEIEEGRYRLRGDHCSNRRIREPVEDGGRVSWYLHFNPNE